MTTLRPASKWDKSGRMNAPYDSKLHNTYRLAYETADIKQFHVTLTITGKSQDQINAKVWELSEKTELVLDKKDISVKPGGSFTLQGKLPKPLTVERYKNGCDFKFDYAQQSDGARWFPFNTQDSGFGLAKFKSKKGVKETKDEEMYCDQSTLPGKTSGTVIECSFPGW
jgi:hypothetical protein